MVEPKDHSVVLFSQLHTRNLLFRTFKEITFTTVPCSEQPSLLSTTHEFISIAYSTS